MRSSDPLMHHLRFIPLLLVSLWISDAASGASLTGEVRDAATNALLPARIYLLDAEGKNHFVTSTDSNGSALPYREQWVPMARSQDQHTTISAHPFTAEVPPGVYDLVVHRGKEYFPHRQRIHLTDSDQHHVIRLVRWIQLNARGWYSGETHVHRRHFELPNVLLAEDLNIAFPVTFWTTQAYEAPHTRPATLRHPPSPFGNRQDLGTDTIAIDAHHLVVPRNTEYEIFSIGEKRHTLGAVFVINHQTVFQQGMPPVKAIAEQAHAEGALLDLDKHSWPWSLMLPPVAKVDLFELSNNSVWQTRFGFSRSGTPADYMGIELTDGHMSERGWLDFGFQCYYALLNCGLRMTPTAGTASGVHPVPLGFSRVYVHLTEPFSSASWTKGLKEGRSFVTTGPMLFATLNNRGPHSEKDHRLTSGTTARLNGQLLSAHPANTLEVIRNGDRIASLPLQNNRTPQGAYETQVSVDLTIDESQWLVVRAFTQLPSGRERFAHTAPFYVSVPGSEIRPKQVEIDYLSGLVRHELERNQSILQPNALAEFQEALQFYESLTPR